MMNKPKRSYMQMHLEEAKLESGRYNADFALQSPDPGGRLSLLDGFRSTAVRLGVDFNTPTMNSLGVAGMRNGQTRRIR